MHESKDGGGNRAGLASGGGGRVDAGGRVRDIHRLGLQSGQRGGRKTREPSVSRGGCGSAVGVLQHMYGAAHIAAGSSIIMERGLARFATPPRDALHDTTVSLISSWTLHAPVLDLTSQSPSEARRDETSGTEDVSDWQTPTFRHVNGRRQGSIECGVVLEDETAQARQTRSSDGKACQRRPLRRVLQQASLACFGPCHGRESLSELCRSAGQRRPQLSTSNATRALVSILRKHPALFPGAVEDRSPGVVMMRDADGKTATTSAHPPPPGAQEPASCLPTAPSAEQWVDQEGLCQRSSLNSIPTRLVQRHAVPS
nr:hypothetical protein CFP56_36463 [Quercus suber]